jgi:hypothetical protein
MKVGPGGRRRFTWVGITNFEEFLRERITVEGPDFVDYSCSLLDDREFGRDSLSCSPRPSGRPFRTL